MAESIGQRLQHAWNAFKSKDRRSLYSNTTYSYGVRPDRFRFQATNAASIVASIYNQISMDVAAAKVKHVKLDENRRYISDVPSGLNRCLDIEANIDQSGRAFMQDVVMSMFDEGCVAIVPVDTNMDPTVSGEYDIKSLRTAKILEWAPKHVRVRAYNEQLGIKEEVVLPKKMVAIIENPFYSVMNEQNSTLQRLVYKLNQLDAIDEQSSSGKMNLIIQLPFAIKTKARQDEANKRKQNLEDQLMGSKYGIAYTDATEKVTQLNRSVENNLMEQIEYLTSMLYSQLGMTKAIFDGTADEQTMLNYTNRTVEPILTAITDGLQRTFLTKTAMSRGQAIIYFREPFKFVPLMNLADIADRFTRNEILSSNELRAIIGFKPSNDPKADQLLNKNLNHNEDESKEDDKLVVDKLKGEKKNGK